MTGDRRPVTFGSLPGVTYWQRRLEEECARAGRHDRPFVAVLVAISGNRTLNGEPLPPAEGTTAIVADTLRRSIRTSDVLCGIAPHRFGLLLIESTAAQARPVVGRLGRLLARDLARRMPTVEPPLIQVASAAFGDGRATREEISLGLERELNGLAVAAV